MMNVRLQRKILTNVRSAEEGECWLWRGQVSNSGFGRLMVRDDGKKVNKMVTAQHASYQAFVGEIPQGLLIRARCGNRLCVNPEHLEPFDPRSGR